MWWCVCVNGLQDGVRRQLAALGPDHVGYGTKQLDEQGYTIMGARPFSKVRLCALLLGC